MLYFIIFIFIYASVVITLSLLSAKLLRHYFPKMRYLLFIIIFIIGGLALTPVPIHGGFSILLFDLLDEARRDFHAYIDSRKKQEIQQKIISRYNGYLKVDSETQIPNQKDWSIIETHNQKALLDRKSGLIWSKEVAQISGYNESTLKEAERRCHDLKPNGYWALPNDSEAFYIWKNKGSSLFQDGLNIWLVRVVVSNDQFAVVGMSRFETFGKRNPPQVYGVRCVALSQLAPRQGYISSDIPLGDWNDYQLSKSK